VRAGTGWLAAGAVLFLAKLGIVAFGLDRGLDIGDEGLFLAALNDPSQVPLHVAFYGLLARFDPPLRFDFLDIRRLRLGVDLAATLVLAHAVFAWARTRWPEVAARGLAPFLATAALGSLLTVGARGFGYNDATLLVVCVAAACMFRVLAAPASNAALGFAAAAGFAIGFQLFVKFPASLLLLATAGIGSARLPRVPARRRLALAASVAAGCATAIVLLVASIGPADFERKWRDAQELNRVADYGVRDILAVYLWHDYASHVNGLRSAAAAVVAFAAARRALRGRRDRTDLSLAAALWAGAAVLAWGAQRLHAPNVHPTLIILFCSTLLLAAAAWALLARRASADGAGPEPGHGERWLPLLLLIALPFFAMVGTNVALTLKLPTFVAPLFVLFAVALPELSRAGLRRFAGSALLLLAGTTTAVAVEHQLVKPYGLPSPLWTQTEETPLLPGLRVDPATRSFLESVHGRMTAAGFEPGDPVIAFDFMPGLVAALGGRSPGLPFFVFDRPAQNCWTIERAALSEPPFVLLGQDMLIEQRDCIRAFRFPEDFRFVGALRNPYEAPIRYFFGGPPMPYLRIFAPADASE
jgi:hypothetical protein